MGAKQEECVNKGLAFVVDCVKEIEISKKCNDDGCLVEISEAQDCEKKVDAQKATCMCKGVSEPEKSEVPEKLKDSEKDVSKKQPEPSNKRVVCTKQEPTEC